MKDYKIPFYITACMLIILCFFWWKNLAVSPTRDSETIKIALEVTDKLLMNRSALSTGVNFESGETIVLDVISGKIVPPCKDGQISFSKEKSFQDTNKQISTKKLPLEKECNLKIFGLDQETITNLEAAQRVSKEPIKAKLQKNGMEFDISIINQTTYIYEGSTTYCVYVGGILRCVKISDTLLCAAMAKALIANKNSMSSQEYNIAKAVLKQKGCVIK